MNIDKIKEFIALREELNASGVIGVNLHCNEVQVRPETLTNEDVQLITRDCDTFPYEVYVIKEGIKALALLRAESLEELFPHLRPRYMEEDIDCTGGEEIA
jgi:hypothetical protein